MAKSKLVKANERIAESVVGGYQIIEKSVVDGYKKIETSVVSGFTTISDSFVEHFLTQENETLAQAKTRLRNKEKARRSDK